jgi:tripartite-type tricarboxylate transporter receptor subunit TctC
MRQRQCIRIAGVIGATAAFASAGMAQAQEYPAKPIRIIVPFAPGGGTDILARLVGQRFYDSMGQVGAVENRTGAGGNIGAELVARSAADGYTLMMSTASLSVNVSLYPKLAYDVRKDFAPISHLVSAPLVLALHPSVPVRTVPELVRLSKQRKGGVNFGSNGSGTTSHLSGALFNQLAGLELTHIPYRGAGAAMTGLLSGETDIGFLAIFSVVPHIRSGKLRGIAVTTLKRSSVLPDLPTLDSFHKGFETDNWFSLFAPAGTAQPIINKLHAEVVKAMAHPDVKSFLQKEGAEPVVSSPAQLAALVLRDIEKYGKIVRSSGAKPDQ